MSDHSKPRRWTLNVESANAGAAAARTWISYLGPRPKEWGISVREDKATSADVEALARTLLKIWPAQLRPSRASDDGEDSVALEWDELSDEAQNGFLLKAATQLDLARIFEGGER
jgi:hypothetical protein